MHAIDKKAELAIMTPFKTLMMVLVVVIHSTALWTGNWFGSPAEESPALGTLSIWLGTFCVPAFFFASGYIYSYLKRETTRYSNSLSVIKRKALRLLVPYCFVSAVWCGPVWALIFGPDRVVEKFILGGSPSQLWFLLALFWLFVISEAMHLLFPRLMERDWFVLGSCVVLYCAGIALGKLLPIDLWQVATSFQYVPFFLVGYVFRRCNTDHFWAASPLLFAAIDILLLLLGDFAPSLGGAGRLASSVLALLARFAGVALALSLLPLLSGLTDRLKGGALERDSLTVYLFHQQLIWVVLLFLNRPGIPPVLVAIAAFAFSLVVSLLIAEFLGRFKATRFLLGQK